MEKQPLISVIVPVYNVEQYLPRCLDSIINQTYTNLEILLIDDGATDNSGKICDEYAQKDNRIRVFHKENGGQASARNLALDNATGEYVAFVDSDDYIEKEMYQKLLSAIQENEADLALCNYRRIQIDLKQELVGDCERDNDAMPLTGVFNGKDCLSFLYQGTSGIFTSPCTKLYHKAILNDVRFPVGKKAHEDEYVTHQIFYNATKAVLIPDKLYYYVQRGNSTMHTRNDRAKLDFTEAMIYGFSFALENKVNSIIEPSCREAVGQMLLCNVKGEENRKRKKLLHKRLKSLIKDGKPYIRSFAFKNRVLIWGVANCLPLFALLFSVFASQKRKKWESNR